MKIKRGETMMYVDSEKQEVLADKQGIPAQRYVGNVETGKSNYPGDKLEEKYLRSDDFRKDLERNQGVLCLTIKPGDAFIGDIEMCIQYEGPKDSGKHEPNLCVHRQNDLMLHTTDWLRRFLHDHMADDSEWEIDMHAHPCPKSDVPLQLMGMTQILESERTLPVVLQQNVESTRTHDPVIGREVSLKP